MESGETQTADNEELFEIRKAGDWVERAPATQPKMLLGDLWLEGEIAVMFAESAIGKSILAVQIADAIARGRELAPFDNMAQAQKVLYIDLGRTGEQFGRRYMSEPETGVATSYDFPDELIRPDLKHNVHLPPAKLASLIEITDAKILIIDSLAFMQKYSTPRETTVVMRELRKLRKRYGLSILLLMNTSRLVRQRGITASDIPCANVVMSFADNVFAIGRSGSRSAVRYIKHIKPGLQDLAYGAAHVPYFEIKAVNGNFPSFVHFGYGNEMAVRAQDNDDWEWRLVRNIKELSDAGNSIRAIAKFLEMSSTSVHRRLQMAIAAPPLPMIKDQWSEMQFFTFEKCIVEGCYGCGICGGRAAHQKFKVSGGINGHVDCPDDCDICGPRRYKPDDTGVDPILRTDSNDYYHDLRDWLLANKSYDRPEYPNARRYGVTRACWYPGSEDWSEAELDIYDRWLRTGWQTRERQPAFSLVRRE